MDALKDRPCGACGELVDVEVGCRHWKPGSRIGKKNGWPRRVPKLRVPADPIECTCGKAPGPPTRHTPDCAKMAILDTGAKDTIE